MSARLVRSMAALAAVFVLGLASATDAFAEPSSGTPKLVGVVNVNTATPEQLELLPGIGPSRAQSVIDHRKDNGPFKQVDDLAQVKGIGDKALERIRPHLVLQGKTTATLED